MANIASGYISIVFSEPNSAASAEISRGIDESGLFSYGGPADISNAASGVEGGFSCRRHAYFNWEWINNQLNAKKSTLSDEARNALVGAEISGYSYEWGSYRDKVEKGSGETELTEYELSYPEFPDALKLIGAFELRVAGSLTEGNGVQITLLSRCESEKKGVEEFEFEVSGDQECTLKVSYRGKTGKILEVEYLDDDEMESTSMDELLDDLLCDRDDLYVKVRGPKKKAVKKKAAKKKAVKKKARKMKVAKKKASKKKARKMKMVKKKAAKKKASKKKVAKKKATRKKAAGKKVSKKKAARKKSTKKKAAKKKAGTAKVAADKREALKDKVVAFTGKLDRMQRAEAEQLARSAGATTTSSINAKVDYLVIGADGFTNVQGDKSSKQKKGEALAKEGSSIQVMSEKKFFALLEQIAQSPEHRFIRDFLKWKKG